MIAVLPEVLGLLRDVLVLPLSDLPVCNLLSLAERLATSLESAVSAAIRTDLFAFDRHVPAIIEDFPPPECSLKYAFGMNGGGGHLAGGVGGGSFKFNISMAD